MRQDLKAPGMDNLVKRYNFAGMGKAEKALFEMYGDRYLEYRNNWRLAGEFKYEPEFPLYIMLEQTYRCNMRCVSCVHGYPVLRKKFGFEESEMSWELFEKIVLEGEKNKCPSIAMHNNDEPLLVRDLEKRIRFAKEHGFIEVIVTTNAVTFTEERVKSVIDSGVTRILFSVDATTEETYKKVRPGGDFNKVLRAIEAARKYRESRKSALPMLRASFVINRLNQHELHRFPDSFSSLVDYVDIQPYCAWQDANVGLIPDGARRVRSFRCNAPQRVLIVRANGDVLPCPNFYGAEMVMGNIHDNTLKDVFNAPSMKILRGEAEMGSYTFLPCKKCSEEIFEVETRAKR